MKEILSNPLKFWMLIGLAVIEIPAFLFLVIAWRKACKETRKRDEDEKFKKSESGK